MPARKGEQPDDRFPLNLTVKQPESWVHATVRFRGEMFTAANQPHGFFNRPPWNSKRLLGWMCS